MKLRLFCSIALLLCWISFVSAQSGRKSNSGSSATTTATTPSVSGKTTEKKPPAAPKLQLLVGIERPEVFSNVPYYLYDTVLDEVVRRLGEADIVFANSSGKTNRADAVKAAKQEKTRWVVQLEIHSIYADAGKQAKNNADELYVSYVALEPETGKIKHSGQTRQHIYQNGRGGISVPSKNGPVYSDYSIKQTATDAADRILANFDISVRNGMPF